MNTQDAVETLNGLMRQIGLKATFAVAKGGWVREHHRETGNTFAHRPSRLPEMIAARERQLARLTQKETTP